MPSKFLSTSAENRIIELLQNSLESNSFVPDMLNDFSNELSKCSDIPKDISILLSNGILNYSHLIEDRSYLDSLRNTFNLIYDFIFNMDVTFKIEGRRKGAINSIEKLLRLLQKGKALDLFRDAMGIRIILFGEETYELQDKTYLIMNEIISFMCEKGFILCEADKIQTNLQLEAGVDVKITPQSSILPLYKNSVKDYIRHPKANGYQSLHVVFRGLNNTFVEIQIRTEEMHLNAEFASALHSRYKEQKYGDARLHSKLDFSNVNMPGFRYINPDQIYDDIGLQKSLLTFYRTKSF